MAIFGKNVSIDRNLQGLRTAPIQSAPLGSSQFVQAPRQQAGGNAARLADSLARLNSSLQRYGSVAAQEQKESQLDVQGFTDPWIGSSAADIQKQIDTEDFAAQGPKAQAALLTLLGSASATEWSTAQDARFADKTYIPDENTINEVTATRQQRYEELKAFNPRAAAAFWKATESGFRRFVAKDQQRMGADAAGKRDLAAFRHVIGRTNDAMMDNDVRFVDMAPDIIAQIEDMKSMGVDHTGQAELLYDVAEYYADAGHVDLAEKLLNSHRGAAGPLADTRDWGEKSRALIAGARKEELTRKKASSFDALNRFNEMEDKGRLTQEVVRNLAPEDRVLRSDAQWASRVKASTANHERRQAAKAKEQMRLDSLAQEDNAETVAVADVLAKSAAGGLGDFNNTQPVTVEIMGPDGHPKKVTFTAEHLKTAARDKFLAGLKNLEEAGADPDFILNEKLDWSRRNNHMLPEWETRFQALANAASTSVVNGEEPDEDIIAAANEFAQISEKNTQVAQSILKGSPESREWLDTYALSKNILGQTDAQAARQATEALKMTPGAKRKARTVATAAVEGAIKELRKGGWFFSNKGAMGDFTPSTQDEDRFARTMTQLMVVSKLPEDAARKQTMKILEESSIVVNGHLLDKTEKDFPKDAKKLMEGFLSEYPANNPNEGVEDGEDLFLMPLGPSKWAVVRKDTGDFVVGNHVITTEDLNAIRQKQADEAEVSAAAWDEYKAEHGTGKAILFWALDGFDATGDGMSLTLAKKLNKDTALKSSVNKYVNYLADNADYERDRNSDRPDVFVDKSGQTYKPAVTLTNDPKAPFEVKWLTIGEKREAPAGTLPFMKGVTKQSGSAYRGPAPKKKTKKRDPTAEGFAPGRPRVISPN
jgi:hypothetical protein